MTVIIIFYFRITGNEAKFALSSQLKELKLKNADLSID
ncbi:hypothetical protein F964_00639 [Acinetobacter guillouiae NIPH 991]|jgi:hypothetical protein|uniref:Uncharacterized protein n=1 Tax=Acinetobacter guillouiae NIPH 991 TaxID=1217656 RepID=N8YBY6_ACIGI|nr:hypothetical protein F964_00639 [Acinetobacter guillouiae NIPH 991]